MGLGVSHGERWPIKDKLKIGKGMKVVGRMAKKSKSRKICKREKVEIRRCRIAIKIVASSRIVLGPIWCSCLTLYELLPSVEHGGIPCVQILIAGEQHVAPTYFGRPSDTDLSG